MGQGREAYTRAALQGVLAIDTSTGVAGIALGTAEGMLSDSWEAGRNHTTTVLPHIDALVRQAGMTPADIRAVVVAIGPGTFTGLRVGVAIAKGLVAARGIPLVGITTLDVIFASHPDQPVVACVPAGRGRVVWARRGEAPRNTTLAELAEAMADDAIWKVVGEFPEGFLDVLGPDRERAVEEKRDPARLAQLGDARLAGGDTDDPVTLEPLYLHGAPVLAGPVRDRFPKP